MANLKAYIGDPFKLEISLLDVNGEEIPDLSLFSDIEIWVESERASQVYQTWKVSDGSAVLSDDNQTVKIVFESDVFKDAKLEQINIVIRLYISDADFENGNIYSSIVYNLLELIKNGKSYE